MNSRRTRLVGLIKPPSNLFWSFHSGLSNDISTDGDSDVFDSDGDTLPQFSAQDDAEVDAYQYHFEPTLIVYVEFEAENDRVAVDHSIGRLSFPKD